jgi:hypothetical protein
MSKRFLTKNIKVSFVNEAEKPKALGDTEKTQKESKKHNDDALKEMTKSLSDLYDFDNDKNEDALENPPKTNREEKSMEEIAAHGPGMLALEYDNEGTEVYKSMMERMDKLNDHSEYYKEFGTDEYGFAEGDGKDTYGKLRNAADDYRDHRNKYQPTPPVRAEEVNESKAMKRLNFKQSFKDDNHMLSLIKEDYKTDNHTFLMTDLTI